MTLVGTSLLSIAKTYLGAPYTDVRCHDLIFRPFQALCLFEEGTIGPGVPDNIHVVVDDFDVRAYVENYGAQLREEYALQWLDNFHNVEPGDILLLRVGGSSKICHLGWSVSPRGPVRHMLHSWNPIPDRPELGSVRYDLVHPRVFSVEAVARIDAA